MFELYMHHEFLRLIGNVGEAYGCLVFVELKWLNIVSSCLRVTNLRT